MSTILRDPNTAPEMKKSAIDAVNQLLEASLAVSGSISNIDLGGLLNFDTGSVVSTPVAQAVNAPAFDLNENYGAGDGGV